MGLHQEEIPIKNNLGIDNATESFSEISKDNRKKQQESKREVTKLIRLQGDTYVGYTHSS